MLRNFNSTLLEAHVIFSVIPKSDVKMNTMKTIDFNIEQLSKFQLTRAEFCSFLHLARRTYTVPIWDAEKISKNITTSGKRQAFVYTILHIFFHTRFLFADT
jgi:hypothetical protein